MGERKGEITGDRKELIARYRWGRRAGRFGQEIPIEGSGFDSAACLDAQYSVDTIPVASQHRVCRADWAAQGTGLPDCLLEHSHWQGQGTRQPLLNLRYWLTKIL